MELQIEKGDVFYQADGYQLFASSDSDLAVMEWDRADEAQLAVDLNEMLKGHALCTNFVDRFGPRSALAHRLEPLPFTVMAETDRNDTRLALQLTDGTAVTKAEAAKLPHIRRIWVDTIEDCALHTARIVRAHFSPVGTASMKLGLTFGIAPHGQCMMQLINPRDCDFGSKDYEALAQMLVKH